MAKYTVYLTTTATFTVEVEVDDHLDTDDAKEAAIEAAFEQAPNEVCAQCSGWRQSWELELGAWDVATEADGSEVKPELRS